MIINTINTILDKSGYKYKMEEWKLLVAWIYIENGHKRCLDFLVQSS